MQRRLKEQEEDFDPELYPRRPRAVLRVWKRDGRCRGLWTVEAVTLLARQLRPDLGAEGVRRVLWSGGRIETKCARFTALF